MTGRPPPDHSSAGRQAVGSGGGGRGEDARHGEGPAAGEGRGYRSLERLARPYKPDFSTPELPLSGAPGWSSAGSARGGAGRGPSIMALVIGLALGLLLAVAVLALRPEGGEMPALLVTVALAALFAPILAAMLAFRLARAPSLQGGGMTGQAEAAADAANAAPEALAVTDLAGNVIFANRRMRRLVPGVVGANLPELLPPGIPPDGDLPDGDLPDGDLPDGDLPDGDLPGSEQAGDTVELVDGRRAALEAWPLPHPEGRRLWRLLPEEGEKGSGASPELRALAVLAAGLEGQALPGLGLSATDPMPAMAQGGGGIQGQGVLWRQWPAAGSGGGTCRAVGFRLTAADAWIWLRLEPMPAGGGLPAMLACLPVSAALLDAGSNIVAANEDFLAMTGWDGTAAGLSDLLFDGEADAETLDEALATAAGGGGAGRPATLRFRRHPERSVHLFLGQPMAKAALASDEVTPDGTGARLALLIDVTEQKGVEQQVAHGHKMQAIGQLAGGVAHDFNNLLTAMIGFCDLLLQRHPPTDQSFADVQQIKQNALRAAGLVRQLLAFSRRQTLRPRSMDVTDVLADLRHLLGRLIGERIRLQIRHGRDLGIVRVDRGQIEQVIINLAVNARDAMREGGTLTISTSVEEVTQAQDRGSDLVPAGRYVRIDIADTGTGVPAEHADKIFEPFFTTKKPGEGTGLGLSTVYGIIRQTGGFVFLERNGPDGATFSILLPEAQPDARSAEVEEGGQADPREGGGPATPRDLTGRETLLLVEDEDAVRLFAARSLRNKGYTVMEAASGEEALDLSRGHDGAIDALVTDVVMPNMDGPTLAQQILKDRPGIALVFMSGYAEDAVRQAISGGELPAAFLQKPFTLNELAVTVRAALSDPESVNWQR